MPLTKTQLDQLRYDPNGPKRQTHYDGGDVPGFGVTVQPSGRKSFMLQYRPAGSVSPRILTIGHYGVLTLQQARELARKALYEAKHAKDPVEAKRHARQGETVRELAGLYMQRHARPHKKTWAEDERRINKHILPAFGSKKVSDMKRADVARLHAKLGDGAPYEANRVLALLAVMFEKAQEWGLLDETVPNPGARVQPFKERSRDRWVTPQELPALWQAINDVPDLHQRCAFKLYLFTGMRRNELLRLRWSDVDVTRREIRLEDTKAGRPHLVPLSAEAIGVIKELPRGLGDAYVFPGVKPGRPLLNIAKSWRRVRAHHWLLVFPERAAALRLQAEADVQKRSKHAEKGPNAVHARLLRLAQLETSREEVLRLHDLRRSVGALMASSGTSAAIVGKVLGHTTPSSTAVYARIADEAQRKALDEHGARLAAIVSAGGGQ